MIKEIIMKYEDNGTNEIPLENIIEIEQEVVRCKECRRRNTADCRIWIGIITQDNDFCSYGEREGK